MPRNSALRHRTTRLRGLAIMRPYRHYDISQVGQKAEKLKPSISLPVFRSERTSRSHQVIFRVANDGPKSRIEVAVFTAVRSATVPTFKLSHIAVPALDELADHRCGDLIGDLDVPDFAVALRREVGEQFWDDRHIAYLVAAQPEAACDVVERGPAKHGQDSRTCCHSVKSMAATVPGRRRASWLFESRNDLHFAASRIAPIGHTFGRDH